MSRAERILAERSGTLQELGLDRLAVEHAEDKGWHAGTRLRVAAARGDLEDEWAAYAQKETCTAVEVYARGCKLLEEEARPLFPTLAPLAYRR